MSLWVLFFITGLGWLLNRKPLIAAFFLLPRLAVVGWFLWDAAHNDYNDGSCVGSQCDDGMKLLVGAMVIVLVAILPLLSAGALVGPILFATGTPGEAHDSGQ